ILKGVKDRTKQVGLFKQIVAMGLSVKATDTLLREQSGKSPAIKGASGGGSNGGANGSSNGVDKTAHVRSLEEELRQKLGVPVEIRVQGKDAGQIVLDFAAHDDFERLLEVLRR
ncbi:MAG TPA: chromosome partitioning protein ParB, partial [Gemmataceae bacterium]|nr:chromosome partitioning protein ParB [Gemmataceae bacterium]